MCATLALANKVRLILLLSIPTYAVTPDRACWFKCVITVLLFGNDEKNDQIHVDAKVHYRRMCSEHAFLKK